jgi:hypothetical protein
MSFNGEGLVRPFQINISDDDISDLKHRLTNTRWADEETPDDWSQGLPLAYAKSLRDYWLNDYDWRARETYFNNFDQYLTEIDGLDIHFIHQPSKVPGARPLLITHGWPGSVVEFHKVIGPLTDPGAHGGKAEDAFHVVCPSLPGYGFSAKPTATGWGVEKNLCGVGFVDVSFGLRALFCSGRRLGFCSNYRYRSSELGPLRWHPCEYAYCGRDKRCA